MLALHIVAGVASDPHVTAQVAVPLQLTWQSPEHATVQLDVWRQMTEPPSSWRLQVEVEAHVTSASEPNLKSHFALPLHARTL